MPKSRSSSHGINPWCLTEPSKVPPTSQYWLIPFRLQISAKSQSIRLRAVCSSLRSPPGSGNPRKNLLRVSKSVSLGRRYCAQKRISSFARSAICARCISLRLLQESSLILCMPDMASRISCKIISCACKASRRRLFSFSKESIRPISFCIERSDGQKSLSRRRLARDTIIFFLHSVLKQNNTAYALMSICG